MSKVIKTINNYNLLFEATHPKTGVLYKIGDNVVLNDDHIICGSGKDYIMKINTMFSVGKDPQVYISENIHEDSEYKRKHWASRPMGSYLEEVKKKISDKEIKRINNAKSLLRNYL